MIMRKLAITLTAIALITLALTPMAYAQATRTWVSGVGDDANPCSRTAPCKTFAGAISKTAAGGEISVLDPGGFGVVTITKSITINGDGTLAGILAAGTNGIIVNAGATDKVIIRSLSINGAGTGLNGIRFLAGRELDVENTSISGFTQKGIDVAMTADAGTLNVRNVSIRSAANGVKLTTTVGTVVGTFENSSFDSLTTTALEGAANSAMIVRNCTINRNNTGILVSAASASATIETSMISFNGAGVATTAAGGVIRLSNNDLFNNSNGVSLPGGIFNSAGNNKVFGNGATAAPNGTAITIQ
jgi:hypothetical protein